MRLIIIVSFSDVDNIGMEYPNNTCIPKGVFQIHILGGESGIEDHDVALGCPGMDYIFSTSNIIGSVTNVHYLVGVDSVMLEQNIFPIFVVIVNSSLL